MKRTMTFDWDWHFFGRDKGNYLFRRDKESVHSGDVEVEHIFSPSGLITIFVVMATVPKLWRHTRTARGRCIC